MDDRERRILLVLDAAVRVAAVRSALDRVAERVAASLVARPAEVLAWEPVPLDLFGPGLSSDIRSSWVFVIRANSASGAERHPNSRQRMMSYRGGGDFQTREREEWRSHELTSDPAGPLESRWISIPPRTWHQGITGDDHWVVVSFQTASARSLIEERPVAGDWGNVRRRSYVSGPE